MNHWIVLALCGTLVWSSSGCEVCDSAGCDGGVNIELRAAGANGIPAGSYDIRIVADAVESDYRCTFPLTQGSPVLCDRISDIGNKRSLVAYTIEVRRSAEALLVRVVGRSGNGWVGPSKVELTLTHASETLFSREFVPTYQKIEPNGPGCGYCEAAMAQWEFALETT